jgi:hypothetical protein
MSRRTRYFLVGSAAVIILGLGTGLVAYYNGNLPLGLGARSADTELAYLPADAAAVGFADVRAVMNSEFRQKLRQVIPTGEELAKFKDELGVDLEKDIDTVSAAYLGTAQVPHSAVVIVRGRFNDVQIETMATQHGGVVSDYKGKRLLTMAAAPGAGTSDPSGPGAEHPAVASLAFLEPGVLALGETAAVRRAIDAGASGDDIRKNAELIGLIDEVRGNGNAWFAGRVDAMTNQGAMPAEIATHLPAVNLVAASLHINGGLSGAVRAEARDDKAGEQLRDVVKGALAAGRLMASQNPKIDAMLNTLQVTGTGKTVGMTFTVPVELLDMLNGAAAAKQLGTGAGAIHK